MIDRFFEKADECTKNDNLKNAVDYFELSLDNYNNYESAYRLGTIYLYCYEDLDLNEPDYIKAIKYFQIGAEHGHNDCQKELGLLLLESNDKLDIFDGIKWLLLSKQYDSKSDLDLIKKSINNLFKRTNQNLEKDIKVTIRCFNEIIKLTRNKKILTLVYECRNELIINFAKKSINDSKTLGELEKGFEYFQRYMEKVITSEVLILYGTKELNFYIDSADNVLNIEQYLLSLNNRDFIYDIQLKGKLYLWLARSYRDGTHNAKKNIDIAIKYYKEVRNTMANLELDNLIISYCDELIKNKEFEMAKKYVSYIKSQNDQYKIESAINEFYKKENFNLVYSEAMLGDIDAKIKLAKLYEDGVGTPSDLKKALDIHKELYKASHLKTSFDFIYNYYCNKNDEEKLIKLLKDEKQNNVPFDIYEEQKYISLVLSEAYGEHMEENTIYRTSKQKNANYLYSKLVTKYKFTGFMHETTIDNLCKILKSGKLSARKFTTNFDDSANGEVLEHTYDKFKEYARFYFYKKTPTNWHFDNNNPTSMVYLEFNWNLIFEKGAIIANGNAGSDYTRIKKVVEFLENPNGFMDWETIFNREFIPDGSDQKQEIIRKRNAELLIPNFVSVSYINRIIFKNKEAYKVFVDKLNDKKILLEFENKIIIDSEYFYMGETLYDYLFE